jgi:hypothetical protein
VTLPALRERHGLSLHVGTHQRAVGVVVLEEGNQAGGDADHLARRDVDELHLLRSDDFEIRAVAGDERGAGNDLAVLHGGVSRGDVGIGLFVGPQPNDLVGELTFVHFAIR